MYLLFWIRTMKTAIVLYQRCMANVSYFRLILFFFFMGLWWLKIIPKIHKEPEPTKALISYIGLYYLLDCDYLRQYEVGITVFLLSFLYEKSRAIGQCHCHWRISVDILSHFNKIVEQYNNLEQVERITCKNVFLLLLH